MWSKWRLVYDTEMWIIAGAAAKDFWRWDQDEPQVVILQSGPKLKRPACSAVSTNHSNAFWLPMHPPTSTWLRVFHLNKHFLLKWCVWLIANSHGHLQQSKNTNTNNLKTVLCHTCIGWVPSGINWAKLLLLCGSQVLKSKTHGGCRIIDFMYTLLYIGPNQCIGENERKRSCLTQHHSERGKPCTPTCDSNAD